MQNPSTIHPDLYVLAAQERIPYQVGVQATAACLVPFALRACSKSAWMPLALERPEPVAAALMATVRAPQTKARAAGKVNQQAAWKPAAESVHSVAVLQLVAAALECLALELEPELLRVQSHRQIRCDRESTRAPWLQAP